MAGVNVKMGVSGVAQFKQGMKESQSAVKTLDAALKLNEAQFKATGDAEEYMQGKSELLKKQIAEQEKVVSQAEKALAAMKSNGVDQASSAFQSMQQQMLKARTDLVGMETQLDNVGTAGDEAGNGVSEMNAQLKRIGQGVSWDNVTNGIQKITDALSRAGQMAFNLGKKIVEATLSGGQWADELVTEATKWEMSPEQLYRMRQTANLIDTDVETILSARKKLTTAMGKEKDKETMGAFAALGIDPTGRHGDVEGVFWEAGDALMNMEDKVDRNEYAMKLFGKSFEDLIPLFKTGREAYEDTMDSWSWIGDEQLENLGNLDDASQKLNSEFEALKLQFEGTMAEVLTPVMETLTGLLKEFNTYLQSEEGQEMLQAMGEAISGLLEDLTNIDPESAISKFKELLDGITEAFKWIKNNKDAVRTALEVIAGGFGLLKLADLALNIAKITNGLGQLFGGEKGTGTGTGNPVLPNQMDRTDAGRPGGDVGKITQGGGWLVGAANAITGAMSRGASALTMFDPTGLAAMIPMAIGDFTTFGRTLRDGGTMLQAAANSWKTIQNSAGQGLKNFTDYFTKDIPNTVWGLLGVKDAADLEWKLGNAPENAQRAIFGSGETHQYQLTEQDLAKAALKLAVTQEGFMQPTDRMTQVAGEMSGEVTVMRAANQDMTKAADGLLEMPGEMYTNVYNAIIRGMSGVTIVIDDRGVSALGNSISRGFARNLLSVLP